MTEIEENCIGNACLENLGGTAGEDFQNFQILVEKAVCIGLIGGDCGMLIVLVWEENCIATQTGYISEYVIDS